MVGLPKRKGAEGPITDINVTPLVDVCLVLVIIFMVIAPFAMQAGIEVAHSRAGAVKAESSVRENVKVVLDEKGRISVNGRSVALAEFGEAIKSALTRSKDQLVSLEASPKANVGQVVDVLDTSKQMGAKRVALINPS